MRTQPEEQRVQRRLVRGRGHANALAAFAIHRSQGFIVQPRPIAAPGFRVGLQQHARVELAQHEGQRVDGVVAVEVLGQLKDKLKRLLFRGFAAAGVRSRTGWGKAARSCGKQERIGRRKTNKGTLRQAPAAAALPLEKREGRAAGAINSKT